MSLSGLGRSRENGRPVEGDKNPERDDALLKEIKQTKEGRGQDSGGIDSHLILQKNGDWLNKFNIIMVKLIKRILG